MAATRGAAVRREQLVAAAVVGTVVVLVAFASGLGIEKNQRAGSIPGQAPIQAGSAAPTPGATPVATSGTTPPGSPGQPGGGPYLPNPPVPQHYVGASEPGPTTSGSAQTSAAPTSTPSRPGSASPTPTPTPTSPGPGCTPTLLQDLVEQLSSVASNLVVLAPLLDKLGLDSPDGLLAQVPVVGGLLVPPSPTPTPTSTAGPALVGMSGPCAGLLTSLLSQAAAS